jgi:hypothetical protein
MHKVHALKHSCTHISSLSVDQYNRLTMQSCIYALRDCCTHQTTFRRSIQSTDNAVAHTSDHYQFIKNPTDNTVMHIRIERLLHKHQTTVRRSIKSTGSAVMHICIEGLLHTHQTTICLSTRSTDNSAIIVSEICSCSRIDSAEFNHFNPLSNPLRLGYTLHQETQRDERKEKLHTFITNCCEQSLYPRNN